MALSLEEIKREIGDGHQVRAQKLEDILEERKAVERKEQAHKARVQAQSQQVYEHVLSKVVMHIKTLKNLSGILMVTFSGLWDGLPQEINRQELLKQIQELGLEDPSVLNPERKVQNTLEQFHYHFCQRLEDNNDGGYYGQHDRVARFIAAYGYLALFRVLPRADVRDRKEYCVIAGRV